MMVGQCGHFLLWHSTFGVVGGHLHFRFVHTASGNSQNVNLLPWIRWLSVEMYEFFVFLHMSHSKRRTLLENKMIMDKEKETPQETLTTMTLLPAQLLESFCVRRSNTNEVEAGEADEEETEASKTHLSSALSYSPIIAKYFQHFVVLFDFFLHLQN